MNVRGETIHHSQSTPETSQRIFEAFQTRDRYRIWSSLAATVHAASSRFIDGPLMAVKRKPMSKELKILSKHAAAGRYRAFLSFHRRYGFVGWENPLEDLALDQIGLTIHVLLSQYGCPSKCLVEFVTNAAPFLDSMAHAIRLNDQRLLAVSLDRYLELARNIAGECMED